MAEWREWQNGEDSKAGHFRVSASGESLRPPPTFGLVFVDVVQDAPAGAAGEGGEAQQQPRRRRLVFELDEVDCVRQLAAKVSARDTCLHSHVKSSRCFCG